MSRPRARARPSKP
uniref:Uncharacterized protein n=1 Tax=Arundo donax TaxID=35708 RepID=A0A0A8XMT2_ARUDO